MVEKCGTKHLATGRHLIYITGFQGRGGVGMQAKYSGPDTGGAKILLTAGREASLFYPACTPGLAGSGLSGSKSFTMCMFSSKTGLDRTPRIGDAVAAGKLSYVGSGSIPAVDIHRLETFREYVPSTPESNYVWAIFGQLQIASSGSYNLCITSDDGYVCNNIIQLADCFCFVSPCSD